VGLIRRHARRLVRQKIRTPARAALRRATRRWCPECQKHADLFHICAPKPDFGRRRAQQERDRRRRGKAAGTPRERRPHDYRACRDGDCQRQVCIAFREGRQACPLPHQG
jgi:hypothetical protein